MVWRRRNVLLGLPVLLLLAACAPTPAPEPTPKTPAEACVDLEAAVHEFYEIASPNSMITELKPWQLPDVNGFQIPHPTCAFEVRPDPATLPGDRFTIETFYVHYEEELTQVLKDRLEGAGYVQKDRKVRNWSVMKLGVFYSASMLIFMEGDGQAYSEAAEGQVLDLSISQG
ncbi:MAG: hypothetical protein ABIQ01_11520 [Pseudolysinimonas sp.]